MATKSGNITQIKLWPNVMSFDIVVDGLKFRTITDPDLPAGNFLTTVEILKEAYFNNRKVRLTYSATSQEPIVINGVTGIEIV